jgi:peptidoglycan/LPS O-acetylase OafA/YrhL
VSTDLHWTHVAVPFGNLRAVPTFFGGVLLAVMLDRGKPKVILSWRAIHLLFAACFVALLARVPDELILIGFALILYCAANAELAGAPTILTTPTFARLGDASFALYLIHRVINLPVIALTRKLGLFDTAAAPLIALASYGLSLGLSVLCYIYFENPVRRYLSNLTFRRDRRAQTAPKQL